MSDFGNEPVKENGRISGGLQGRAIGEGEEFSGPVAGFAEPIGVQEHWLAGPQRNRVRDAFGDLGKAQPQGEAAVFGP